MLYLSWWFVGIWSNEHTMFSMWMRRLNSISCFLKTTSDNVWIQTSGLAYRRKYLLFCVLVFWYKLLFYYRGRRKWVYHNTFSSVALATDATDWSNTGCKMENAKVQPLTSWGRSQKQTCSRSWHHMLQVDSTGRCWPAKPRKLRTKKQVFSCIDMLTMLD